MILMYIVLFFIIRHVMLIFQFILSLIWKPAVKDPYSSTPDFNISVNKLNQDYSGYLSGDGAKFVSMFYACMQTDELWEEVKKFWDTKTKTFFRHDDPDTAFSGDMLAGMNLALATRYNQYLKDNSKLTDEEKKFICDLVWNITFCKFIPFKFNTNDWSRGYTWLPWFPNNNGIFQILTLLKLACKLESNIFKKGMLYSVYGILFSLNWLIFIFGMYDHNIYWNKTYACWWYGTHSDAITYAAAKMMNISFASKGLKILNKRYGKINADIAALAYHFLDETTNYNTIYMLITDLLKSKTEMDYISEQEDYNALRDLPKAIKKWFNGFSEYGFINNMKNINSMFDCKKKLENRWVGGRCCFDYSSERNPQDRGRVGSHRGDLDVIFPLKILNGCFKF